MEEAIARPGEKRARAPSAPPDQLTKHHRTHDIKIVQPQSNSTMAPVPCPGPGPGPGPGLGPDPNPHSEPTPMVSESADLIEIKLNELEAKIFTLIKNMLADNSSPSHQCRSHQTRLHVDHVIKQTCLDQHTRRVSATCVSCLDVIL
eukprot:701835-Amorphochlora_amoeboformis.AAC.1